MADTLVIEYRGRKWKHAHKLTELDRDVEPLLDIRQKKMWDFYVNPKSETYGNAYQSGLRAGYKKSYSRTITQRKFFLEKMVRLNLLNKAEKVFDKTLDMETADEKGKEQADLLRVQTDVAKHISKTLGKDEGYAERSEITGKDGSAIIFMPAELIDKYSLGQESQ